MKIKLIAAISLLSLGSATAATVISYTASADPVSSPDANGNTVNAWTVASAGGGSFFDSPFWGIFHTNDATAQTTATHSFAGGAVTAGQTVSITYQHETNINNGQRVGIRLLDASNAVQTEFSFLGGGSSFQFADTGGGFTYAPTGKAYDPNDPFTVSFNFGAGTSYSGTASQGNSITGGTGAWSGTYTNPITQIQVFTNGGDGSGQRFNNLTIIPEPSSALLGALGAILLLRRRK